MKIQLRAEVRKREKKTRLFNSANETRNLAESQEFICSTEHVNQSTPHPDPPPATKSPRCPTPTFYSSESTCALVQFSGKDVVCRWTGWFLCVQLQLPVFNEAVTPVFQGYMEMQQSQAGPCEGEAGTLLPWVLSVNTSLYLPAMQEMSPQLLFGVTRNGIWCIWASQVAQW